MCTCSKIVQTRLCIKCLAQLLHKLVAYPSCELFQSWNYGAVSLFVPHHSSSQTETLCGWNCQAQRQMKTTLQVHMLQLPVAAVSAVGFKRL